MWKGLSYKIVINMKQKRYSPKEVAELVRHFSGLYRKENIPIMIITDDQQ